MCSSDLAGLIAGTVPTIKPAAEQSQTRVIGVLGTNATVRQPYVDDLSARFASDCLVLRHGSADLVELAEASLRGGPTPDTAYADVMAGLLDQEGGDRMDTIVLACTHFPLVAERLAAVAPRPLTFVDGAKGIARRVAYLTRDQEWPDAPLAGVAVFTAPIEVENRLKASLARFGLTKIERL